MRIYVQVPQQLSAGIRPGLTADLTLPQYPDKTFKSTIATTSSAINMAARTLLVELHADNPDGLLQPGAYAQVTFELPTDPNVVRIPTSALLFRGARTPGRNAWSRGQDRAEVGQARAKPRNRRRSRQRSLGVRSGRQQSAGFALGWRRGARRRTVASAKRERGEPIAG